jgi:hypothetical protein
MGATITVRAALAALRFFFARARSPGFSTALAPPMFSGKMIALKGPDGQPVFESIAMCA